MPSQRKWRRDINYNILSDKRHWTESTFTDPDYKNPETDVHVQWRRNLNNNVLMNLFGPDPDHAVPAKQAKLTFDQYYNGTIVDVLSHFAERMDTLPWDKDNANAREHSKFMARKVRKGKKILEGIVAQYSTNLGTTRMRVLYTRAFYAVPAQLRSTLLDVLEELDHFRSVMQWICLPFLNLPRTTDDIRDSDGKVISRRPTDAALDFHINGYTATVPPGTNQPTLPDGQVVGNLLNISQYDFEEFLFFSAPNANSAKDFERARNYAASWRIFDPLDVVDRLKVVDGFTSEADVIKGASYQGILSSGNGYRCQTNPTTGARECVPSNPSAFCVANGTNVCP